MNGLIKVENGLCILDAEISSALAEFERIAKEVKKEEDELKEKILAEMEQKGILKVDTEDLTISYIAPTNRETFDSKRFRADNPDTYDEYVSISPVKASVRIKVK